jgi:hypothetical protein
MIKICCKKAKSTICLGMSEYETLQTDGKLDVAGANLHKYKKRK